MGLGKVGGGFANPPLAAADGSVYYFDANWGWRPSGSNLSYALGSGLTISDTTASTTALTGALIVAGGVGVSGAIHVTGQMVASSSMVMDGAAGSNRDMQWTTSGSLRWNLRIDSSSESGSNAGSNFFLTARSDAGSSIDNPIGIVRAAGGLMTLTRPISATNSTASSSTTTGALVVTGGVGISGALNLGGVFTFSTQIVASVNNGGVINADLSDTAASRTVALCRVNSSATAHTSAGLLDVISGASTSSDIMLRLRASGANTLLAFASGAITISGSMTVGSATLITTTTSFTNGAAAQSGTLTNAPAAGNPTKWIPVNDNGTTRYIPAW